MGASCAVSILALAVFLPERWVLATDSAAERARAAEDKRLSAAPLSPSGSDVARAGAGRAVSAAVADEATEGAASALDGAGEASPSRVAPSTVDAVDENEVSSRTSVRSGGSTFGFDFFTHPGATRPVRPGDGQFVDHYPDGGLAVEGRFENGEREGEWEAYHPDGSVRLEGHYSDGKRVGRWKAYHPSGQLLGEGEYSEGFREGTWVLYYSNGLVKEQGFYEHDLRHGPWQYYDGFGQLEARSGYYRYGRMVYN